MSRDAHPKCSEVPRDQKSILGAREGFDLLCQPQYMTAWGWICPSHRGPQILPQERHNTQRSSKGLKLIILYGPIHQVAPGVLQAPLVSIKGISSELKIN